MLKRFGTIFTEVAPWPHDVTIYILTDTWLFIEQIEDTNSLELKDESNEPTHPVPKLSRYLLMLLDK